MSSSSGVQRLWRRPPGFIVPAPVRCAGGVLLQCCCHRIFSFILLYISCIIYSYLIDWLITFMWSITTHLTHCRAQHSPFLFFARLPSSCEIEGACPRDVARKVHRILPKRRDTRVPGHNPRRLRCCNMDVYPCP